MWRWMIHGLGGLIAMMAAYHAESREPIPSDQAEQLAKHIRDLTALMQAGR